MSEPNVTPPLRLLGCLWLSADQLTRPTVHGESIHFSGGDIGLAFVDLDTLDAVIGKLTAARYMAASAQLAAESARRDSTPPVDRKLLSPAGDRRENSVPCSVCRADTWNINGRCAEHQAEKVGV